MTDDLYISRASGPNEVPADRDKVDGCPFTVFSGEVNSRTELDDFVRLRGRDTIYRKITDKVCPKYDPATSEQHPKECKWCMGTKHMYQDYIVKMVHRLTVNVESQAREGRQDVGYMGYGKHVYYMKAMFKNPHTMNELIFRPTLADFILDIEVDENAVPTKTYRITNYMDVQFIYEARDQRGRTEFFAIYCAERPTGS